MKRTRMPKVDLTLDQRNIIITRSKEGILDIKKIFISKGANVFDLPAISIAAVSYTHLTLPTKA